MLIHFHYDFSKKEMVFWQQNHQICPSVAIKIQKSIRDLMQGVDLKSLMCSMTLQFSTENTNLLSALNREIESVFDNCKFNYEIIEVYLVR